MERLPPELVTPPEGLPVSLDEAKQHLRVDHDLDDDRIEMAIAAAVAHLDGYGGILGRALLEQTWREHWRCWPATGSVALALAPVTSVGPVVSRATDGTLTTLDEGSAYRLLAGASSPTIRFSREAVLPSPADEPDAIAIDYVVGYGTAEDVPAPIRHAILLMVGDMYRFTESAGPGQMAAVPMSTTVERLLAPYRRVHL